jgi:cyanophycin synthetase
MITVYDNGTHIPVLWSHLIPATIEGKATHNVQNSMFAVAMAYGFGVDLDNIRHGLRTFDTSFFQAPGRTNVFDKHPFKVILDYAHNPAAFAAIADLADRMEVSGRRLLVVSAPGNRRDEDVMEATRILAGHFDHYICKADDNRRQRGNDEIPNMLRQGLIQNGVSAEAITIIPDEVEAIDHGLNMAQASDLLVVLGDDSARSWKQIIYFKNEDQPDSEAEVAAPAVKRLRMDEIIGDEGVLIRDERGVRLARNTDEDGD